MECSQAQRLFDAYLDGELSKYMMAELDAHRVRCEDCRRDLALLEVSGHVISADAAPCGPQDGFTDRLLACMDERKTSWTLRFRRSLYVGAPIAAAAVIALAFLGVFDKRPSIVAGQKSTASMKQLDVMRAEDFQENVDASSNDAASDQENTWVERIPESLESKRQSVESLQGYFDLTILQWLDMLNADRDASQEQDSEQSPVEEAPTDVAPEDAPEDGSDFGDDEDVEDL